MIHSRSAGILMHITSLPGSFGIGDMGPEAYAFADFLIRAKQSFWQILPLAPPNTAKNHSPYNSLSAFAGNPVLISPEELQKAGLLHESDLAGAPAFHEVRVDYEQVEPFKAGLFDIAVRRFESAGDKAPFERFCTRQRHWLDDYALYVALCDRFDTPDWCHWPPEVRDRRPDALATLAAELSNRLNREKILQYLFFQQWWYLRQYCNYHGISIIGDMPLYVAYQSADVWAHPELFQLNDDKTPTGVSGVPPDFFSNTGQLWGNPLYHWPHHKETGYHWWMQRIRHNLVLCDLLRIDHFRGLVQYWQVPSESHDASNGTWEEGPGRDFFQVLFKFCPTGPFIVEDLGLITADVREIVHRLHLGGMKVLMFAFGEDGGLNPYLPHNHTENSVVYPGTHDNNTIRGWLEKEADDKLKKKLVEYLGLEELPPPTKMAWEMIHLAMSSVARTCIIQMQDCLALGQEARMNWPSKPRGNWRWRVKKKQLSKSLADKLARATVLYGRS